MAGPNRAGDPGESEFGGAPDDPRVDTVPDWTTGAPGPTRALLDAYWIDPDDPGATPDELGSHIGDDDARVTSKGRPRSNQFKTQKPTWPKRYSPY